MLTFVATEPTSYLRHQRDKKGGSSLLIIKGEREKRKLKPQKQKIMEKKKTKKEDNKKVRWVIDPETGKNISKTGYAMRLSWKQGGMIKILDMKAVLK